MMTLAELIAALDRVLTWRRERREDVDALVMLIEDHDKGPHRLSDEQAAEAGGRAAPDVPPPRSEIDEGHPLSGV